MNLVLYVKSNAILLATTGNRGHLFHTVLGQKLISALFGLTDVILGRGKGTASTRRRRLEVSVTHTEHGIVRGRKITGHFIWGIATPHSGKGIQQPLTINRSAVSINNKSLY
jgi:hypothetical protein